MKKKNKKAAVSWATDYETKLLGQAGNQSLGGSTESRYNGLVEVVCYKATVLRALE